MKNAFENKKAFVGWLIIVIIVFIVGVGIGGYFVIKNVYFDVEEPLIGGCAGVSLEYRQECCDNWAEENNIVHIQCVGEWVIEDNQCKWECESN